VTYLDVGLKLEVEPNIYLEDEVGIKLGLEVSNIAREIRARAARSPTRWARAMPTHAAPEGRRDAGARGPDQRRGPPDINQIPGLGDLPIVGRLFGNRQDTRNKTEIVLLMTPRVIRNLARPDLRFEEFPSGTEAQIGAAPLLLPGGACSPALEHHLEGRGFAPRRWIRRERSSTVPRRLHVLSAGAAAPPRSGPRCRRELLDAQVGSGRGCGSRAAS